MKVTEKMIETGDAQLSKCYGDAVCSRSDGVEHTLQEVLDEILPPPGTNPLAAELAPQRSSLDLSLLRRVLAYADSAERDIRERMSRRVSTPPNMYVPPADPEAEQILTTLITIRRALMPWAKSDWTSLNAEHDETEQA